jgi:lipid A 1-phosphatase
MNLQALARQAYAEATPRKSLLLVCVMGIILCILWPTNLASYRATAPEKTALVLRTDHYLRFTNTIAQIAIPVIERDPVGMMQLLYVGVSTTLATHGLKHLLDHVTVWGTQLGERPSGGRHNMPSGHSSMASCALYFVCRRYGWHHALYMLPVTLLTMFARVELNVHTASAVIAGALVGILMSALFTSKRKVPETLDYLVVAESK